MTIANDILRTVMGGQQAPGGPRPTQPSDTYTPIGGGFRDGMGEGYVSAPPRPNVPTGGRGGGGSLRTQEVTPLL